VVVGFFMPVSGKEMLKLFRKAGWKILRSKGSYVVIGKDSARETIPMHKELKKGLELYLLKRLKGE
jgi:predicted RNA binding protein YcfA (HicA-like mRNA interferase family)